MQRRSETRHVPWPTWPLTAPRRPAPPAPAAMPAEMPAAAAAAHQATSRPRSLAAHWLVGTAPKQRCRVAVAAGDLLAGCYSCASQVPCVAVSLNNTRVGCCAAQMLAACQGCAMQGVQLDRCSRFTACWWIWWGNGSGVRGRHAAGVKQGGRIAPADADRACWAPSKLAKRFVASLPQHLPTQQRCQSRPSLWYCTSNQGEVLLPPAALAARGWRRMLGMHPSLTCSRVSNQRHAALQARCSRLRCVWMSSAATASSHALSLVTAHFSCRARSATAASVHLLKCNCLPGCVVNQSHAGAGGYARNVCTCHQAGQPSAGVVGRAAQLSCCTKTFRHENVQGTNH